MNADLIARLFVGASIVFAGILIMRTRGEAVSVIRPEDSKTAAHFGADHRRGRRKTGATFILLGIVIAFSSTFLKLLFALMERMP